mmetsp:Transcript_19888/g.64727  ORF Transcript_19888/g.64727 Transcript_19888/m.64727 type:complete len:514 (-) Transcript_19888:65-1606(-)
MGGCFSSPEKTEASAAESAPQAAMPRPHGLGKTPVSPKLLRHGSVLGRDTQDVHAAYSFGKVLGKGQFGTTYETKDKRTGKKCACKQIPKRKLKSTEDVEDVRREVAIMHHLGGHQNIVNLFGAYEDDRHIYLVMEVCAGGELFDRITARGRYTEKQAADCFRTMMQVLQHCHSMGVIHRDLKPENFLLSDSTDNATLKATDFGLSVYFRPGQAFHEMVGSAYYVAPEVLRKNYSHEADIWSAGVILYILLSGVPPFWSPVESGIFDAVLRGKYDLKSDPWPNISESAKDCIRRMLVPKPSERMSVKECLEHPWVKEGGDAPDTPLNNAILDRMGKFARQCRFKKLGYMVLSKHLSLEEVSGLKAVFDSMDENKDGTVTIQELQNGLKAKGHDLASQDIKALIEAIDVDGNGQLDYQEFVAATIHYNKIAQGENLVKAFEHFDKDSSGYITKDELAQVLSEFGNEVTDLEQIIAEADQDNDGRINYDEFVALMTSADGASQGMRSLRLGAMKV